MKPISEMTEEELIDLHELDTQQTINSDRLGGWASLEERDAYMRLCLLSPYDYEALRDACKGGD